MKTFPSIICTINDVDLTTAMATVKDSFGKNRTIRMDLRKGGGPYPRVGDVWIIAQTDGQWTFDTLLQANPHVVVGNAAGIDALENTLSALDAMGFIDDQTFSSGGEGEEEAAGGLIPGEPIYFTTPGAHTFTKADYPGAAAFIIEAQGGGGAGGGAVPTGASTISAGGGGGGGGYARSVVPTSDLDATEAITVGAGGTGVSGSSGGAGIASTFDTISGEVKGQRGEGGALGSPFGPPVAVLGGLGGVANTGDFTIPGDDGERGLYLAVAAGLTRAGGSGGSSFLGASASTRTAGSTNGNVGHPYGGGGSGAHNGVSDGSNRTGGAGASGVVIVTPLYPPAGGIVGVGAPGVGLIWGGTIPFDADDVFTKSDYIGIKGVLVECQGGGGGGGGAPTVTGSDIALATGGSGGGYARRWIPVASLAPSEAITVGDGGGGGTTSTGGSVGENSSFGSHCVGNGGVGGGVGVASAPPRAPNSNPPLGGAGTGDHVIRGKSPAHGSSGGSGTAQGHGMGGGDSHWGAGVQALRQGGGAGGAGQAGLDGNLYGGGGGGAVINSTQTGAVGGDGARGRVLVHLYYASGGEGGSPPSAGWIEGSPIYYKTTGAHTFTKADYPGARAFKIECCGAGGGSGGAAASAAGDASIGGGGGGGGYARSIVPYDDLAPTEAITVGAGGTAGAAAAGDGGSGGDSVFDTISGEVRGKGGGGGGGGTSVLPLSGVPGGSGGALSGNVGDFVVTGGDAIQGFSLAATRNYPSGGGTSFLSNTQSRGIVGSGQAAASVGNDFGGGAYGPTNSQSQSAQAGAAGGPGIVIVTPLY